MGRARRQRSRYLSRKLKAIREHFGYTRAQMAEALNVRYPGYINGYENGQREPTFQVIVRYAELASCSSDYLIDDRLDFPPVKTVRNFPIATK